MVDTPDHGRRTVVALSQVFIAQLPAPGPDGFELSSRRLRHAGSLWAETGK
jgi:hypothetical protein